MIIVKNMDSSNTKKTTNQKKWCPPQRWEPEGVDGDNNTEVAINKYVRLLMDYNINVNLISRKMTSEGLDQLLRETVQLNNHISENINTIVDAGSGSGILGIPIAVINKNRKIVLVEPRKKKANFLREVKSQMDLSHVEIYSASIKEYLEKKNRKKIPISLVARGFPNLCVFCNYVKRGLIEEVILITSENKIKNNKIYLESVKKKTYNIPLRNYLKILKMEKTAREV